MRFDAALRWGAVVVAGACAIAVATLVGLGLRPPRYPGRVECAQRLEKLGRALRIYAGDHEGRFPVTATPGDSDERLLPLLRDHGVSRDDFHCPALAADGGAPYTYHCYESRGPGDWPKWMPDSHMVTEASPPDTWLIADHLARHTEGPHSDVDKAFNYLSADGRVSFRVGRPRDVYR